MTGYQSDQFFNIGKSRPDQWSRNRSPSTFVGNNALNDDFLFPDKTIRHIKPDGTPDTKVLQKGYIRRINEFNDSDEGPLICRFQFNPQFINQAASFQSGMVNPIYQPIEQLQQPIASMTNFSFRLIFDRSMEVNSSSSTLRTSATDNPWEAGGPSQVGVLHDINSLFRVIGQGISASDVEGAIGRAREALAATDQRIGKDELSDEDRKTYTEAVSNATQFFQNNVNVGNTAFILPYPVRIVFSSLYIVEGFITQTSLEILKFSSSYVPMMAQVTMSVSAVYIGFAKRNTYFTHVLEQSAVERRNSLAQETAIDVADLNALKSSLSKLTVKLSRRDIRPNRSRREVVGTGIGDPVIRFNQLFTDAATPTGFAYTNPLVWANPTDWVEPWTREQWRSSIFTTKKDDDISVLFENGSITDITFTWKATLFGPVVDPGAASSSRGRFTDFPFTSADDVRNNSALSQVQKFSSPENRQTVTTKKQWQELHTPDLFVSGLTADPPNPVEPLALPKSLNLTNRYSSAIATTNSWVLLIEADYLVTINGNSYSDNSFKVLSFNRSSTAPLSTTLDFLWSRYDEAFANNASSTSGGGGGPSPGSVSVLRGRPADGISIAI
jgi:hypothetical protein